MTKRAPEDGSGANHDANLGSTPDSALAQKLVVALVADGLISQADGASIRADLAAGKMDLAKWKLVLENQLEREAHTHERE